ncbi:MAG: 50S ribosomal protein L4 [Gemmatimonadota bacterium]|nr:50S ribosomal protein L4 [Gemmatimonadota bacterium]
MAETTNSFDAAAYTGNGTARPRVSLPEDMFDGVVNRPVLHQAVKAFLANQRQGNAATKTRGKVIGGNQKPWKQKGTGRARQGSIRAPNWVGGGTVFGPIPRSYAQFVPKQVRALARRSAFNARAREGAVIIVDAFNYDAPKTSRLAAFVERLGVADQKVLILTDGVKSNLHMSGRNIPSVHVLPYSDVSAYHILWSDVVVIEGSAIGQTLEPVADTEPTPRVKAPKREPAAKAAPAKKKTAAKKAVAKKADKAPAKKKAAAKPAKKDAAKKPAKKAAAKKSAAKPKKKGK